MVKSSSLLFFKHLEDKYNAINISKTNILHIGDSFEADVFRAKSYNIKSKHIDPKNENLLQYLTELLNKNK
jgi:predicted HAD superfamily hydrolase